MMPRGRAWTQQEIACLLAFIGGCRQVTLLMASTSRPNEALWREISRRLALAGYSRNVAQCRSKWKALKQAFYSEWETRRQQGGGRPAPQATPHYKTMKRIWEAAGRPVFGERRLPDLGKLPPHKDRDDPEAKPSRSLPQGMAGSKAQDLCGGRRLTCSASACQAADSPSACEGSLRPLPGSPDRPACAAEKDSPETAGEEQAAADGGQPSGPDGQGPGIVSLLQSMQQILVQILRTSRQQQLLLESLASDTVSHLHVISDNLVQVGETLHELLLQSHAHSADPYGIRTPLHGGPSQPCSPGAPSASPLLKEEAWLLPATGFRPHGLAPP
ncbi:uncharacterized protein LOC117055210 [Lacerta agilis]|uniref:uncharacterized protein LOC117055210 n=1 Tax=Lacerta agilis TaxID=80427 RepID=UPI001419FE99|nr:uncharacterized protein LOC117055210 [Lacerta agilis]